jgi:hypothetical protein
MLSSGGLEAGSDRQAAASTITANHLVDLTIGGAGEPRMIRR